jgi:class 3 adenylate cyclase/streptogramin lyase
MSELPAGAVTFLFTDIEGSTKLVRRLREGYADVLAEHQRLLREAFGRYDGREVDTQGDAFFVAFPSARGAVLAAVDAQRSLSGHAWPDSAVVRVRMGIHTGQATPSDGRYTGLAVHRAARIAAAAHGGQVLVSQATESLLEDDVEELGIGLRDLGRQQLKDIDRPVRLYQLEAPELQESFPPLRTLDSELRAQRRRRVALAAAAVLALLVALAAALLVRSRSDVPLVAAPNSVAAIAAGSNSLVKTVAVGETPSSIASGEGALWVLNSDEHTVSRLDPDTGEVVRTNAVPAGATEVAVGAGSLWVATNTHSVARLDPESGLVTRTYRLPRSAGPVSAPRGTRVAGSGSTVWAGGDGVLARLAPAGPSVSDSSCCGDIALDRADAWATDTHGVIRIHGARLDRTSRVALSFFGRHIALGPDTVWVTNQVDDQLWRIDPRTGKIVDVIHVGTNPSGVAAGAGAVWVANGDGTVARVDPDDDRVVARIRVGGTPNSVAVAGDRVWVTVD